MCRAAFGVNRPFQHDGHTQPHNPRQCVAKTRFFLFSADVNECVENEGRGPCEQTCENRDGGYVCGCDIPGYVITIDQHTCRGERGVGVGGGGWAGCWALAGEGGRGAGCGPGRVGVVGCGGHGSERVGGVLGVGGEGGCGGLWWAWVGEGGWGWAWAGRVGGVDAVFKGWNLWAAGW